MSPLKEEVTEDQDHSKDSNDHTHKNMNISSISANMSMGLISEENRKMFDLEEKNEDFRGSVEGERCFDF